MRRDHLDDRDMGPVLQETGGAVPGIERYCQLKPNMQELMDPVEICHSKRWHWESTDGGSKTGP
jgi:hypothetical protein